MTLTARGAATSTRERGASLVGLLLVVIILGVMAAAAVSAVGGSSDTAVVVSQAAATTSRGESTNTAAQATLSAACVADFQILSAAVQVFATLHGVDPKAGTAWATGIRSGTTLLQAWPSDPGHFSFTWNGSLLGVVPRHGVASRGSPGRPRPATGCFAALV